MSLSGDLTRRLLTVVLEQGQKLGLDMAGSFLGPAWPIVRPLIEKLIEGLPERIAKTWKNSDESLQEALDKINEQEEQVKIIGDALSANGISAEWANTITLLLSGLSDDVFQILCNQASAIKDLQNIKQDLHKLLETAKSHSEKKPARIVIRGIELEYVDLLRVPEDFLPGYDLSPSEFALHSVSQRHMPAGFLVWTFSLFNDGQRPAIVRSIGFQVTGEGKCPPASQFDELKPTLDMIEDRIMLTPGETFYPIFRGKRFSYKPDESDAFRVQVIFIGDEPPQWQQLQPVIRWDDGIGEHTTYAPEIFIASHPHPQIERAKQKFGIDHA